MLPKIEQLIAEYNLVCPHMSFRELAAYERNMWKEITSIPSHLRKETPESKSMDMSRWFGKYTLAIQYEVHLRSMILSFGEIAEELIDRIEAKEMTIAAAYKILRTANIKTKQGGSPLMEAVEQETAKYDRLPHVTRNREGFLVRKKRVTRRRSTAPVARPDPAPPKAPKKPENEFWNSIRQQLDDFLLGYLPNTDLAAIEDLAAEVRGALRAISKDFHRSLADAKERDAFYAKHKVRPTIDQQALEAACNACQVDVPSPGKPVDLHRAWSNKRSAARAYHPDKQNEMSEHNLKLFHEVIDSYRILKEYNAQLERS